MRSKDIFVGEWLGQTVFPLKQNRNQLFSPAFCCKRYRKLRVGEKMPLLHTVDDGQTLADR